jgi:ActR/RegA family two-component response regulator
MSQRSKVAATLRQCVLLPQPSAATLHSVTALELAPHCDLAAFCDTNPVARVVLMAPSHLAIETLLGREGERVRFIVNFANAIPTARFSALLVEGDKALGLEGSLREEGCSVRRATSASAALDALPGSDLVVIGALALSDDEVVDLIGKANGATVLVIAGSTDLAVRAAKLGASVVVSSPNAIELANAQIKQLLSVVDLKRKVARHSSMPVGSLSTSPTSGVVQRRSAPLPKEATPDALDALIESAEGLVPMHKFQRVYVDYALRRFGGNKVHTAAALGIDRRTIQRWARARVEQRPVAPQPTTTTTPSSSS